MTDTDLALLQQQQHTMIIELRALTASIRRMDSEIGLVRGEMNGLRTEMTSMRETHHGMVRAVNAVLEEIHETNRKIDDIAARLGNLEIAR